MFRQIRPARSAFREFKIDFEHHTRRFKFPGMSAPVFRHTHRVSYAECTLGNHVYYSRYLDLLEAARGDFFRQLGSPLLHWQERDVIFLSLIHI